MERESKDGEQVPDIKSSEIGDAVSETVSSFVTKRLGSGTNLDKFIYIHQTHSCCYCDERKPH